MTDWKTCPGNITVKPTKLSNINLLKCLYRSKFKQIISTYKEIYKRKENEMAIEYGSGSSGNWLSWPKIGETYDFSQHGFIVNAEEVTGGNVRLNYKKKVQIVQDGRTVMGTEDTGKHHKFTFEDGKHIICNNYSLLFQAVLPNNLNEGVKFICKHPTHGKWIIEITERQDGTAQELTPF